MSTISRTVKIACLCALAGLLAACAPSGVGFEPVFVTNGEQQEIETDSHHQRGVAHLLAGRIGLALQDLRRALREQPSSIETLNAIAVSYDELQRFDLSRRYFERGLLYEPTSPQTLNNMGWSLLRQDNPNLALKFLRLAGQVDGSSEIIQTNLQLAERYQQHRLAATDADTRANAPAASLPQAWIVRTSGTTQSLVSRTPEKPLGDARIDPYKTSQGGQKNAASPMASADTAATTGGSLKTPSVARPDPDRPRSDGRDPDERDRGARETVFVGAAATPQLAAIQAPARRNEVETFDAIVDASAFVEASRQGDAGGASVEGQAQELVNQLRRVRTAYPAPPRNPMPAQMVAKAGHIEAEPVDFHLEVSNGAGRRSMAARMGTYLSEEGLPDARLTNADRFTYRESIVFYRPGFRNQALRIASKLPVSVSLRQDGEQYSDVRLRLGGDLLSFDAKFLLASERV